MRLSPDGTLLRDEHGRHRVLHGVNLPAKGERGAVGHRAFRGRWTAADLADLARRGLTLVRLTVIWAAAEPEPGRYDGDYLAWVGEQLDLAHGAGLAVVLDAHQDLYAQRFGDGAPAWATLTEAAFGATDLWSDAYLTSPAVQEAFDAFWANAPGPGGVGLQDRFAALWGVLAARFGNHPALAAYDLLNEPAPGAGAVEGFAALVGALGHLTGQDPERVAADLGDPDARVDQLAHLDDPTLHRAVGDHVAPLVAAFDAGALAPFTERVLAAVRSADARTPVLREHGYLANVGVPPGIAAPADTAWAYSPHGYDLVVDTAHAARASDTRAGTIFARFREEQERLGVPVVVGEWGALGTAPAGPAAEAAARHATFLADRFDEYGWSWAYWCWEPGFDRGAVAAALTRPRPLAFAGTGRAWRVAPDRFTASWDGTACGAPTELYLPWEGPVRLVHDGAPAAYQRDGAVVRVPAGTGGFALEALR